LKLTEDAQDENQSSTGDILDMVALVERLNQETPEARGLAKIAFDEIVRRSHFFLS
jgi:hypothetical protein